MIRPCLLNNNKNLHTAQLIIELKPKKIAYPNPVSKSLTEKTETRKFAVGRIRVTVSA